MATKTKIVVLNVKRWAGAEGGEAPEGYYASPYLDRAWRAIGNIGDCPETFGDEEAALSVAAAVEPDLYGVAPILVPENQLVCPACGERKPESEFVDSSTHNTGGETICLACHQEIIAGDSDLHCPGCKD